MKEPSTTAGDGLHMFARWLGARDAASFWPLLLIHANITIYALTFWMQQPVMPFLSKSLGADAVTFGYLKSTIGALALVGGPIMGRVKDRNGYKTAIIIGQLGSACMYGLMSVSHSLPVLFLSRLPALVQHAMLCAQAAIADLSSPGSRATAMGRLTLSYGVGMVFGSPLGGYLSKHAGYHFAAAVAAALSVAVIALDVLLLPAPKTAATAKDKKDGGGGGLNLEKIVTTLRVPAVRDLVLFSVMAGLGVSMFRAMFSLFAADQFHMTAEDLGYYMSFSGQVGVVANAFLVDPVVARLGDFWSLVAAAGCASAGYAAYTFAQTYSQLLAVTAPTSTCNALLYVFTGALMTKVVPEAVSGTAISLSHASRSLNTIVAPVLGGYVYTHLGFGALCLGACATTAAATAFLAINGRKTLTGGGNKK